MAEQDTQAAEPSGGQTPIISAEKLMMLAQAIFFVARSLTIAVMLQVGEMILKEIYQDDLEIWAKRNEGDQSLDRLALELQGMGLEDWTTNQLYRSARLAEQDRRLGGLDKWSNLTASHFRTVQGLPVEKQRELLDEAEKNRPTVEQLQAQVSGERARRPASGGDDGAAHAVRTLKRIAQIADDSGDLAADLNAAGASSEEISAVVERLQALKSSIDPIREKLAASRKQRRVAPKPG